jgi:glycosyltransferase involved in cell wall biosynthesis
LTAATARTPLVVHLPYVAESIAFAAYAERIADTTLLEWGLDALCGRADGGVYVVHRGPHEAERLAPIAKRLGLTLIPRDHVSELACLLQVGRALGVERLGWARLEHALTPPALTALLLTRHEEARVGYATTTDLPTHAGLEVVSVGLLAQLAALPSVQPPTELRARIETLRRAGAVLARAGVDLRTVSLSLRDEYGLGPADVPGHIAFETSRDVEIARTCIGRGATAGVDLLRRWRNATVSLRDRERVFPDRPAAIRRAVSPASQVLYVSNASACAGAEEALCQLVGRLDPVRYRAAAVVGMEGEFSARLRAAGARVYCPNRSFESDWSWSAPWLTRVMDECQPDLVHMNGSSGMPVVQAARERRAPIVTHVRVRHVAALRGLFHLSSRIFAVSACVRDAVLEHDVSPESVDVVYDGVDCDRYRPDAIDRHEARAALGIPPGRFVLLLIARAVRSKRHDLFLTALARLRDAGHPVHGLIVGELFRDATADDIPALIARLGLGEALTCLPFQPDIRRAHAAADALVLCSDHEALGQCVLEALAMERPVVVTRCGGLTEVLTLARTGSLVETGSVESLVAALVALLGAAPREIGESVRNGRRFVEQELTSGKVAERVMDLYDGMLAKAPVRAASA